MGSTWYQLNRAERKRALIGDETKNKNLTGQGQNRPAAQVTEFHQKYLSKQMSYIRTLTDSWLPVKDRNLSDKTKS